MPVVKKIWPPLLQRDPGAAFLREDATAARRFRSSSSRDSSLTMAWYRHSMLQKARSPRYMKTSFPWSGRRHVSQHDRNSATRNAAPAPQRLVAQRPPQAGSDTSSRAARRAMEEAGAAAEGRASSAARIPSPTPSQWRHPRGEGAARPERPSGFHCGDLVPAGAGMSSWRAMAPALDFLSTMPALAEGGRENRWDALAPLWLCPDQLKEGGR
jgi:hypothetical protein